MRSLVREGIDYTKIEQIFISHTHPDHVMGLPLVLLMMKYPGRRTAPLTIHFPKEAIAVFEALLAQAYILRDRWSYRWIFVPIEEGRAVPVHETLTVQQFPTQHLNKLLGNTVSKTIRASCFCAVLREGEKKAIFSSDIASVNDVRPHVQNADVLIIECAHVALEDIVRLAKEQHVRRTIVTHVPPELDAVDKETMLRTLAEQYGVANITFAYDGMKIEI
jgi:ribonuclease Z